MAFLGLYWGEENNPNNLQEQSAEEQTNDSGGFRFYWGADSPNAPKNRAKNTRTAPPPRHRDAPTSRYFREVGAPHRPGGWSWNELQRQPKADVCLRTLVATQAMVVGKHLDKHARRGAKPDDGDPVVIEQGGKRYLINGHHRAVSGMLRGDQTIRARVMQGDEASSESIWTKEWFS